MKYKAYARHTEATFVGTQTKIADIKEYNNFSLLFITVV